MKTRSANKIGRKRRMVGWTLLTLGVLVAGMWVASRELRIDWHHDQGGVSVHSGMCVVCWERIGRPMDGKPMGWLSELITPGSRKLRWQLPGEPSIRDLVKLDPAAKGVQTWVVTYIHLPTLVGKAVGCVLWPIPLLLRSGIVARRRALTGKCKSCGYDLAGLPPTAGAKCPECGKGTS